MSSFLYISTYIMHWGLGIFPSDLSLPGKISYPPCYHKGGYYILSAARRKNILATHPPTGIIS